MAENFPPFFLFNAAPQMDCGAAVYMRPPQYIAAAAAYIVAACTAAPHCGAAVDCRTSHKYGANRALLGDPQCIRDLNKEIKDYFSVRKACKVTQLCTAQVLMLTCGTLLKTHSDRLLDPQY